MAHQLYMDDLAYNEDDHWADQANCQGLSSTIFEYQEKDSPLTKDMSFGERLAFNQKNFEEAAEICIECPVMFQCIAGATKDDKQWTVRGGEPPTRFAYEKTSGQLTGVGRERVCVRGHHLEFGGRCKECKRIAMASRRAAARAAKQVDTA